MKPYDTTAKDVRNIFDLIHHYDLNYDKKILNKYNLRDKALELIKSILYFAWTDEADILHPTERQIKDFLIQSMQVIVKTTDLKSGVREEKITIEVSIDYPDERLFVTLVDYI